MPLKRRFVLLLLLPVTAILLSVGTLGFYFIQRYLFDLWTGSAQLKLGKAAEEIRMRLDDKLLLVNLIVQTENVPHGDVSQSFLIDLLRKKLGVQSANIEAYQAQTPERHDLKTIQAHPHEGSEHLSANRTLIEPDFSDRTLLLERILPDEGQNPTRRLVVKITLDSFLDDIQQIGLWKGSNACLITADGYYLTHTDHSMHDRIRLGDGGDPIEKSVLNDLKDRSEGIILGKGYPPALVMGFQRVPSTNWYVILYSKGSAILEPIIRFVLIYLLGTIGVVATILMLIRSATEPVARSLGELSSVAEKIENGDYTCRLAESGSGEIGYLNRSFNQMMDGIRQRDVLQGIFGRYVDDNVARELMSRPELLRLGGEERVVTILMADLTGFTDMEEQCPPEEVVRVLNKYLATMIGVISAHSGLIVDFFGSGILAFFDSAGTTVEDRAASAIECAFEMRDGFQRLQDEAEALQMVGMAIGIHTDTVIVGNIGSEIRTKYGIVGSAVNLTERIKSSASASSILVSGETYRMLEHRLKVGPKVRVVLKGLDHYRDLYPVAGIDRETRLQ